ncbi:Cysteine rich repeat [Popillia japonica]|uniref:Cysteine rich repeat n=1 Tax=Popillia japonica TaxID=7064 RepID=A0AAW1JHV9_POPJA
MNYSVRICVLIFVILQQIRITSSNRISYCTTKFGLHPPIESVIAQQNANILVSRAELTAVAQLVISAI